MSGVILRKVGLSYVLKAAEQVGGGTQLINNFPIVPMSVLTRGSALTSP